MQISVAHNLQLYEPGNTESPGDPGIILPIADAQAVMGETVAAYVARVGWRFELPTVLIINGEYYARASGRRGQSERTTTSNSCPGPSAAAPVAARP